MKASIIDRMLAYLIDFILLDIAATFIILPFVMLIDDVELKTKIIPVIGFGVFAALILLKDVFGRSAGKRIKNLQILSDSGENVPKWKLILRNITFFIMPIELIAVALSDENKRLMDMLLGLKVIKIPNLRRVKHV